MKRSIFWDIRLCSTLTNVSDGYIASIFRVEKLSKQEIRMKQVASSDVSPYIQWRKWETSCTFLTLAKRYDFGKKLTSSRYWDVLTNTHTHIYKILILLNTQASIKFGRTSLLQRARVNKHVVQVETRSSGYYNSWRHCSAMWHLCSSPRNLINLSL
jgi:hypothetical protein